jgi:8-oxo-dGTP diphosphatase
MNISEDPATIVVDVANVMGARPDGWWRDRAGAAVRLYGEVAALAASGRAVLAEQTGPPRFVLVLEGAANAAGARIEAGPTPADRVRVVLAPGHGDDAIVAVVRELPGRRVVVTADRELRDRCAAAGAEVLAAGPAPARGLRCSGRPARSTGRPTSPSRPRRTESPDGAS